MRHISSHGGRFVTIVPHGRSEDTWFRNWAQTHAPDWTEARRAPAARAGDPDRIWRTFQAPAPSTDGYRVIWVHSSGKAARDAAARAARIEAGLAAIEAVALRLASPKTRLKTHVAAEAAAINAEKVSYDAVTDGCFPLVTNDPTMTGAEVLGAYHYQPNLERRNHLLTGPQAVAPVYLETAHRIEALLTYHFLAMLTEALLEREIRTSMKTRGLAGIPLYPELRNCPAPSAPRILEIFDDLARHQLINADEDIVQTFQPQLSDLQQQILDLLHIPANIYNQI